MQAKEALSGDDSEAIKSKTERLLKLPRNLKRFIRLANQNKLDRKPLRVQKLILVGTPVKLRRVTL